MRWFGAVLCCALLCSTSGEDYASNEAVQLFQEYLKINTTSYNNLGDAVAFWQARADDVGVELITLEFFEGFPVLVIKWPGSDSSLGSIMLNSHMDVVPADEDEGWTYPPFSGTLDDNGVIWGRGTQDMKSVSIQYFEALKRIKANGTTLLRDVYMTLMPDEEIGGTFGMVPFLASETFTQMNIALELDEGTSSGDLPIAAVFYQDKVPWQIQIDCYGESAHSSTFPKSPASVQCANVIAKFMKFRGEEYVKYETMGGVLNASVYTVVNLNVLSDNNIVKNGQQEVLDRDRQRQSIQGGTANNVIPSHISLIIDIRLATSIDEDIFDAQLNEWITEAGENVTLTYLLKGPQSPATLLTADNPFWTTFSATAVNEGLLVLPIVPPGATDARYVRDAGFPAFGFSPMPSTEILLHSVDERLSAETFLRGIDIYEALIQNLANIPGTETSSDPSVYVISTTTS